MTTCEPRGDALTKGLVVDEREMTTSEEDLVIDENEVTGGTAATCEVSGEGTGYQKASDIGFVGAGTPEICNCGEDRYAFCPDSNCTKCCGPVLGCK